MRLTSGKSLSQTLLRCYTLYGYENAKKKIFNSFYIILPLVLDKFHIHEFNLHI